MFKEFKDFAMRGNVVDMAIGVVLGGAFGAIVDSIVKMLMSLVTLATAGVKFEDLAFKIKGQSFEYGATIQAIISFIIIAFVMFLIVKAMNKMAKPEVEVAATTKSCPYCMSEIPLEATRCPNCTSELEGYNNPVENK